MADSSAEVGELVTDGIELSDISSADMSECIDLESKTWTYWASY